MRIRRCYATRPRTEKVVPTNAGTRANTLIYEGQKAAAESFQRSQQSPGEKVATSASGRAILIMGGPGGLTMPKVGQHGAALCHITA